MPLCFSSGSRACLCREQSRASLLYLPLYLPCHRNPPVTDNVHEVLCHGNTTLLLYIFKKINISQLGFIILVLKIISYNGFTALPGPRCPLGSSSPAGRMPQPRGQSGKAPVAPRPRALLCAAPGEWHTNVTDRALGAEEQPLKSHSWLCPFLPLLCTQLWGCRAAQSSWDATASDPSTGEMLDLMVFSISLKIFEFPVDWGQRKMSLFYWRSRFGDCVSGTPCWEAQQLFPPQGTPKCIHGGAGAGTAAPGVHTQL